MPYTIDALKMIVTPIAEKYGIKSLSVFGSYSKGTANADSDVDFLISKGNISTLFELSSFRLDLEDALQIPVDLVTYTSSDIDFLDQIQRDEVMLYQSA